MTNIVNSLRPESTVRLSVLQLILMVVAIIGFSFAYLNTIWDMRSDIRDLKQKVDVLERVCK